MSYPCDKEDVINIVTEYMSKNAILGFNSSFPLMHANSQSLSNSKELQEYKRSRSLVPIENPASSVPQTTFIAELIENNGGILVAGTSRENPIPETLRESINATGTLKGNVITKKKKKPGQLLQVEY